MCAWEATEQFIGHDLFSGHGSTRQHFTRPCGLLGSLNPSQLRSGDPRLGRCLCRNGLFDGCCGGQILVSDLGLRRTLHTLHRGRVGTRTREDLWASRRGSDWIKCREGGLGPGLAVQQCVYTGPQASKAKGPGAVRISRGSLRKPLRPASPSIGPPPAELL